MSHSPVIAERSEQAHLLRYTLGISLGLFWLLLVENYSFLRISGQESCIPATEAFPWLFRYRGEEIAPLSSLLRKQLLSPVGVYDDAWEIKQLVFGPELNAFKGMSG